MRSGLAAWIGTAAWLATTLAGLAASAEVQSQPAGHVHRIGYLATTTSQAELEKGLASSSTGAAAFARGLRARGWHDGKNIRIVWRSAADEYGKLPELAREMARLPVDVIVTFGFGVDAAVLATRNIPIVGMSPNLVRPGWANSLAHPGGNLTGIASAVSGREYQKQLAWLKEAMPRLRRVGLVAQTQGADADEQSRILRLPVFVEAAKSLELELSVMSFGSPEQLPELIRSASRQGIEALLFDEIAILSWPEHQRAVAREATRHRLLIIHSILNAAENGWPMAFGRDLGVDFERLAHYVDRILRGAKAGDLPIEQTRRRELHVNRDAAKAIGLELPASILLQADRVWP